MNGQSENQPHEDRVTGQPYTQDNQECDQGIGTSTSRDDNGQWVVEPEKGAGPAGFGFKSCFLLYVVDEETGEDVEKAEEKFAECVMDKDVGHHQEGEDGGVPGKEYGRYSAGFLSEVNIKI